MKHHIIQSHTGLSLIIRRSNLLHRAIAFYNLHRIDRTVNNRFYSKWMIWWLLYFDAHTETLWHFHPITSGILRWEKGVIGSTTWANINNSLFKFLAWIHVKFDRCFHARTNSMNLWFFVVRINPPLTVVDDLEESLPRFYILPCSDREFVADETIKRGNDVLRN